MKPLLQEPKTHNKTHIRSRRIITDRTKHQQTNKNNLTNNGSPTGPKDVFIEH